MQIYSLTFYQKKVFQNKPLDNCQRNFYVKIIVIFLYRVIIEHARGPARGRDDRYGGSNDRGGGRDRGGSDRRPGWIDK